MLNEMEWLLGDFHKVLKIIKRKSQYRLKSICFVEVLTIF
jgi:hypothetical protein